MYQQINEKINQLQYYLVWFSHLILYLNCSFFNSSSKSSSSSEKFSSLWSLRLAGCVLNGKESQVDVVAGEIGERQLVGLENGEDLLGVEERVELGGKVCRLLGKDSCCPVLEWMKVCGKLMWKVSWSFMAVAV